MKNNYFFLYKSKINILLIKMKSEKLFVRFFTILLVLSSINEIFNFKCGADQLKLKPKELKFDKETNDKILKKVTAASNTPIKIGMDYSSFRKPSAMTTTDFNTIRGIIDETLTEFQKFLRIQHANIDLTGERETIMEGCDLDTISSSYSRFLIDNDLIVFPSFSNSLGDNVLAAAGSCLTYTLSTKKIRPVAGILYINPKLAFDKTNTKEYMKHLLLHEITHILVFSPNLMQSWGMISKRNSISYVTSPKVLIKARQHFNCASINGMPLENQGGQGSAGSHWEARYMLGDYMISTDYMDNVISDISIALFEDSGIYDVEYYSGGLFKFGKNKGCSFLNSKCIANGSPLSEEFCTRPRQPMCSQSRTAKGFCGIYQYTSTIPSEYQYFSDPSYGGFSPANYCPITSVSNSDIDYYPSNCKVGNSTLHGDYGEAMGSNSFCFLSSLLPTSSSQNSTYQSICYRVSCNSSSKQIIVSIGSSTVNCPTNGGNITDTNFKGVITCPKYTDICDAEDNEICNSSFDCLSNAVEADEDSYEYDKSNSDFTRIRTQNSYSSDKNIQIKYILYLGTLLFLFLN